MNENNISICRRLVLWKIHMNEGIEFLLQYTHRNHVSFLSFSFSFIFFLK